MSKEKQGPWSRRIADARAAYAFLQGEEMRRVQLCQHCCSRALPVCCVICNREMCEDCIHVGEAGKVCGLCLDREAGRRRYELLKGQGRTLSEFDEWYDQNA
jgi:hypothetical protein